MRFNGLTYVVLSLVLSMVTVGLLSAGPDTTQVWTNEYCPVTTTEKADPHIFVDYGGRRIHFCCQKCMRTFLANPDKYLENLETGTGEPPPNMLAHAGSETEPAAAGAVESREHAGHDHATDHDGGSGLVAFLGKFHPVVVHFPIALVIMSAIFVGTRIILRIEILDEMAVITMYWAAMFAVLAALLGLARSSGAEFPSTLVEYFEWHRLLGLVTAGMTAVTALTGYVWRRSGSRKAMILFRGLLILNSLMIGVTGHLGATLIFGPHYYG